MTVTPDAIKKAKELLGIIKAEVTTTDAAPVTTTSTDDLNKAKPEEITKLKAEYNDTVSKAKEYADKAEAIKATLISMGETNGGSGLMPNVGTVSMKAEEVELIKAEIQKTNDDLQKGINDKLDSIVTIYKGVEAENAELKKSITEITEKLGIIAKQTPGPKSIQTQNFIEKGGQGNGDGDLRTLSLTQNKREVIAELVKAAGAIKDGKFEDGLFAKAASTMEFAGTIGENAKEIAFVADRLKQKSKIRLVN